MALKFKTKRDASAGLLPKGIYKFVIESSEEKSGTEYPLAALQLRPIVNGKKHQSIVFENLSSSPKSAFRVNELLDAIGVPNEDGEVDAAWFRGKVGWARFDHQEDQDGKLQVKVKRYLTEAQAERAIEKLVEQGATDDGAMTYQTQRSSRPAPSSEAKPARSKAKTAALVGESGTDEDIPF